MAGASLTTGPLLDLRLAHSRARDAVHEPLDEERLAAEFAGLSDPVLVVASAAGSRSEYLMRPDLGRRLAANAEATLASHAGRYDVKLHDVTGRSCLVKNVTVRATGKYAFSIAEKDLTDCKK